MRGVAIGPDRRLVPTELEERPLGPEEVRVRVAFCGICGSDIHLRASPAVPPGAVMGHEFLGTVSEVGEHVKGFSSGDRVAVFPFAPCGECPNCRRGDYHVCQQAASNGLGLGINPGAYAESVVVAQSMLIPLPDALSLEHGALVEPLAVALHGIDIGEARTQPLGFEALGLDDVHQGVMGALGGDFPDVFFDWAETPPAPPLAIEL